MEGLKSEWVVKVVKMFGEWGKFAIGGMRGGVLGGGVVDELVK